MTAGIEIIVVAGDPARGEVEAARLAAHLGRQVPVFLLRDQADRPRHRLLRAARKREREGDASDLTTHVRQRGVTLVVAADHQGARAARHAVDNVRGVTAVQGADAAARVAGMLSAGYEIPGGTTDDVLGRTRFVPPLDRLPEAEPDPAVARLVIGPANRDGRASEWALLASTAGVRGVSVQRVDGGDARTASADLSISGQEWGRPDVRACCVDKLTRYATHVLESGMDDLLPDAGLWAAGVQRSRVLDVVDLMTPDDIAEALDEAGVQSHGAQPAAWLAGAGRAQTLVELVTPPPLVTSLVPRSTLLGVLPLVHAHPLRSGPPIRAADERPLVVTAPPAGPLTLDPEADRVQVLASEGLCRHLSLTGLPPSLWRSAIRSATIVVDRVWLPGLGLPGMLALEAGRTTIAGSAKLPTEAPVVHTTLADLDGTLRERLESPTSIVDEARGAAFVADQRRHAREVLHALVDVEKR